MENLLKALADNGHTLVGCMLIEKGGYVVLAKPINPTLFGHTYVTWMFGNGGLFWGHYHNEFQGALDEFTERLRTNAREVE